MNYGTLFINTKTLDYFLCKNNEVLDIGKLDNKNFLEKILSYRLNYIYVWEANLFFAFIDNYSVKNKLKNYAFLNEKQRIIAPTISIKDGTGAYYQRKVWLKTYKADSTSKHKRISSTCFINFSNYFGGKGLKDTLRAFGVFNVKPWLELGDLLEAFNKFVLQLTGFPFLNEKGKPVVWTMGGLAKKYYLKLYDNISVNAQLSYIQKNPQNKRFEYLMRDCNLLLPGILYLKDRKLHKNIYSYDINSLFPAVEKNCPFLGVPKKISYNDYIISKTKSNKFEFIFLYRNLKLKLKINKPAIFKDPKNHYKGINKNSIYLSNQAFFGFYVETLEKFYDFECEDVEIYSLTTRKDYAIEKYVNTLYGYKVAAKKEDIPAGLYSLVKFLLNNLHGKFAQLSLNEEYGYIVKNNIISRNIIKVNDNWETSHFDYLRGAWVYAKSQVLMLEKLLILEQEGGYNLSEVIYYIDTDSLSTTIPEYELEKYLNINDYSLGDFKYVTTYTEFKVFKPKVYAGYEYGKKFKLTCAGLRSTEIIKYLDSKYPNTNYIKILSKPLLVPNTIIRRTDYGAHQETILIKFGSGFKSLEKEGILYDTHSNTE